MGIIINPEKRRCGGSAEGRLLDELRFLKLPSKYDDPWRSPSG